MSQDETRQQLLNVVTKDYSKILGSLLSHWNAVLPPTPEFLQEMGGGAQYLHSATTRRCGVSAVSSARRMFGAGMWTLMLSGACSLETLSERSGRRRHDRTVSASKDGWPTAVMHRRGCVFFPWLSCAGTSEGPEKGSM